MWQALNAASMTIGALVRTALATGIQLIAMALLHGTIVARDMEDCSVVCLPAIDASL